jgi:putative tributyrin esterase
LKIFKNTEEIAMAFLTMHTLSAQLKMTTLVNVILPDALRLDEPLSEKKVLYLLHGLSDNGTGWLRRTNIEVYAEKYGLVVVMPSVDRSFYCDNVNGQNYFTYITKELPDYLQKVFGLSRKKEQNFIAGLSMGGYGAMRAALTYPEQYFAVASFSGVLALEPLTQMNDPEMKNDFSFLAPEFARLATTPLNPPNLLRENNDMKMYVACGLQDYLLSATKIFEERAKALGVEATFVYEDGEHTWPFWDRHIALFLDFALNNNNK